MENSKYGSVVPALFSSTGFIRKELEKRRSLLYRLAYSWCHSPALADDLVQEAMLKALSKASQLKNTDVVNSWLGKILANCWYDHLRREKNTVDLDTLTYDQSVTDGDANETHDMVRRVRAAIAELPIGQRQAITLVDLAGFSYVEIANILDIPIGTVMSRISRARQSLKVKLADHDPERNGIREKIRRVK